MAGGGMSVVNEALRDLQQRRAQVMANRALDAAEGRGYLHASALSLAVVRNWVHQPVESAAFPPQWKMGLVFIFLGLLIAGRLLWAPFFGNTDTESLKIQLSNQFHTQEKSAEPHALTRLQILSQLNAPVLPQKIMQVISAKKTTRRLAPLTFVPQQTVVIERYSSIKPTYQVQDDLDHAVDLAQDRGYEAAKTFLAQLIHRYPKQPEYAESLLKLMVQNKQWDQAWPLLTTARQSFPRDDGFKLLEARYYIEQKQWVKAHDLLNADPNLNQVEYLSLLAMIKQEIKDLSGANTLYLRLHQLDANNPAWQLGLGLTYEAMGNWDEARRAYTAAQNSTGLSAESYQFIQKKLAARQ